MKMRNFRRLSIDQLKEWHKFTPRKPLILNGARQVGKTSLMKSFAKELPCRTHYINFEIEDAVHACFLGSLSPREIIAKLALSRGVPIDSSADLLIFDEIQSCPRALHSLKYFAEDLPDQAVIAAGSLLGISLSNESYPVGKVREIQISPMNFFEFLCALDREDLGDKLLALEYEDNFPLVLHETLFELWKKYLIVGGLPEVVGVYIDNASDLFKAVEEVRYAQLELVGNYTRDMAKHAGKTNSLHLERIIKNIPAQLARVVDDSVKRFRFGGVVPGISQYSTLASAFDWLERANLVHRIQEVHKGEEPLGQFVKESFFKLYMFDVGILGAIGGVPAKLLLDFTTGFYKGYIAENYVIQALKGAGLKNVYGWREGESEVEFVWQSEQGIVPIEVKSGQVTRAKSLTNFCARYAPRKAVIFGATRPRVDGAVHRLPIYVAGLWDISKLTSSGQKRLTH